MLETILEYIVLIFAFIVMIVTIRHKDDNDNDAGSKTLKPV